MNKDLPTDPRIPQPNIVLTQGDQGPSQSETKTNAPLARESAKASLTPRAPNLTPGSTRTGTKATSDDDDKPKYKFFDYLESTYGSGAVSSQFLQPGPSRAPQRYVGDLEPITATLEEVLDPLDDPPPLPTLRRNPAK